MQIKCITLNFRQTVEAKFLDVDSQDYQQAVQTFSAICSFTNNFLATLVTLHFTPVSELVSNSFELA